VKEQGLKGGMGQNAIRPPSAQRNAGGDFAAFLTPHFLANYVFLPFDICLNRH